MNRFETLLSVSTCAATVGSREITVGVGRAEGERRDECARRAPSTAARLATARAAVSGADESRARAAADASLIVQCVDPHGYNASVSANFTVGRCRLTASKPVLKAPTVSALESYDEMLKAPAV